MNLENIFYRYKVYCRFKKKYTPYLDFLSIFCSNFDCIECTNSPDCFNDFIIRTVIENCGQLIHGFWSFNCIWKISLLSSRRLGL
ncbi:hypothetical protein Hanom_Chr06g00489681 [Helianthus anomalus]